MADPADVARLRRLTDEALPGSTYDNPTLSTMIDNAGSVELAAGAVWREKAAGYAGLVDVSEGSSTRRLSQLQASALQMANVFDPPAKGTDGPAPSSRPRSRAITRPRAE